MHEWSPFQRAIFEDVARGTGHTVVNACAGSGKTSTLVEAMNHVPPGLSTLFVAFNKAIADELTRRLAGKPVTVSTLHSYGLRAVTAGIGRLRIHKYRVEDFLREWYGDEQETRGARGALAKAVSLAKGALAHDAEAVDAVVDAFGIELPNNIATVLDLPDSVDPRDGFVAAVVRVLDRCRDTSDGCLDFDDMVWLPIVHDLPVRQFDRVFVDERQDLCPAQLEMVLRAVKPGGRVCAVGDEDQCIPAGQTVSTPRGGVPIEQLREGDEVLAVKAGMVEPRRIVRISKTHKESAFEYDLGEHGVFRATAEHVLFASIDDPKGSFVYLMYRPDMGFRIGVSRTVGRRGKNFHVRTQQEGAERLWVLRWFPTYGQAAEMEAWWAYEFSVPREPFVSRLGMWSDGEATTRLFEKFGSNGRRLLLELGFDFDRPNYMAKATSRGRVAVNLLLATKDGHKVEIESAIVDPADAELFGMLPTIRGTMRLRKYFHSLREARALAESLAERFGGYVVESLACTSSNRRMFAVRANSVHNGMLVPVVGDDGRVFAVPVIGRREVPASDCYDLEVEGLGNFIVNGVVVHNCVYQFRGANARALRLFTERLQAKRLPLSISYRCARAIVDHVRTVLPEIPIQAAADAHAGEVAYVPRERMEHPTRGAQPGDFILSRTNAPLIGLCLKFLRAGRRANIQGRDVGDSLAAFVKKSGARTVEALRDYVEGWCEKECARLSAKRRDTQAVEDRAACLLELSDAETIADVVARIEELFSDRAGTDCIVLSSTHKAKGLERDRVWLLVGTYMRRPEVQEMNLYYVAVTRARRTLFLVEGFEKKSRRGTDADPEANPLNGLTPVDEVLS